MDLFRKKKRKKKMCSKRETFFEQNQREKTREHKLRAKIIEGREDRNRVEFYASKSDKAKMRLYRALQTKTKDKEKKLKKAVLSVRRLQSTEQQNIEE